MAGTGSQEGGSVVDVAETQGTGVGVQGVETASDLVGLPAGVTGVDGNPARLGLTDAAAEIERRLAGLNLPRAVAQRFVRAVEGLATQSGQNEADNMGRVEEVMRNIDGVIEDVVERTARMMEASTNSAVEGMANGYNRRREEQSMAAFREQHGISADAPMPDVPATC